MVVSSRSSLFKLSEISVAAAAFDVEIAGDDVHAQH